MTLRGAVVSYYQKRLAARDARDVGGVVWVNNLLSVGTAPREDESLRDDLRFALAADSTLSELNITIRVKEGLVTLLGDVNTLHEKEHAADVVSRVLGVRDVINNITVNNISKHSDTALKGRIKGLRKNTWAIRSRSDLVTLNLD